jgi:hypothetical protein
MPPTCQPISHGTEEGDPVAPSLVLDEVRRWTPVARATCQASARSLSLWRQDEPAHEARG